MTKPSIGIYIPTAGRADRQFTLQRIPPEYRDVTRLVVPREQYPEYSKYRNGPQAVGVLQCPVKGIGRTRQWILENTKRDYIMLFDDDMYFYHRIKPRDWHLATNSPADNKAMLDELFAYMINDDFVHIGLATRTEASFYLCSYRVCTRVNNVHGFNVKKFLRKAPRFDELPVMEDFNVTLSLLKAGIPNKVMLDYVWNQPGSNSDGGCSTYRTPKLQAKAAHALHALHPEYVKVVEKKVIGSTSWEGMKTRTDVRIDWHRAWLSSGLGEHRHWEVERRFRRKAGGK